MGSGRNKYLVCDGVDDRFAIVLAHESIAQFKRISLGSQPLDEGALCGLGTVHLGKLSPDNQRPKRSGMIEVRPDRIKMLVCIGETHLGWETVLVGRCNATSGEYLDWSFVDMWDEWFFSPTNLSDSKEE